MPEQILNQLVHAWDLLTPMTPPEYSGVRDFLRNSSGSQNWQVRSIEFIPGNKKAARLKPHAHRPEILAHVDAVWRAPSLCDEALRLLARCGLDVLAAHTERDWTLTYVSSDAV